MHVNSTPPAGTRQDLADMKERAKSKEPVSAAGRPVLLVCPPSVLSGWEDHLALWGFFSSQSILSSGGDGKGSIEVRKGIIQEGKTKRQDIFFTEHQFPAFFRRAVERVVVRRRSLAAYYV